jgi:hypothetical protein
MYAVMKAYPISSITTTGGLKLEPASGQPTRIIPVFDTYEQAGEWHGSVENIVKLNIVESAKIG